MGEAADIVKRWVELYSDGTPETYGSDRVLELYAPNADWMEMPSSIFPAGRAGNTETLREALNQQTFFVNRQVELLEIIEEGKKAAWTAIWSATFSNDIVSPDGRAIKAGTKLRIRMAVITEVENGLIVRQHEYVANPEGI